MQLGGLGFLFAPECFVEKCRNGKRGKWPNPNHSNPWNSMPSYPVRKSHGNPRFYSKNIKKIEWIFRD